MQREEVRVEREPITDANRDEALDGPTISEEEHEVVLHAEEPVVEKRAVPKERVRLDTETVTDEREISEEVRKERIDVDDRDHARVTDAPRPPAQRGASTRRKRRFVTPSTVTLTR